MKAVYTIPVLGLVSLDVALCIWWAATDRVDASIGLAVVTLTAILLFFIVRWHAANYGYHCPKCHHEFRISAITDLLSPHTFTKKWLRCPKCGLRSWCRAKPVEELSTLQR